ncbi:MAG: hypothetical protein WCJ03_01865 [Bacteroidales bacterium]
MAEQEDLFVYDDEESIKFIKNYLPQEMKDKFEDDDLAYIVDLIYEYYDDCGLFDAEDDQVVDIDEEALVAFVAKQAKKDKVGIYSPDEVMFIVRGELEYCESIGMFE